MAASKHFWTQVASKIHKGNKVAEIYNGERADILLGLAEIVGNTGRVYGVDRHNPFAMFPQMKKLYQIPQIRLVRAEIPPLPYDLRELDAIVVREFIWSYDFSSNKGLVSEKPELYKSMANAIKEGGHLILHLNPTESKIESSRNPSYQKTIEKNFLGFTRTYFLLDCLVYKKGQPADGR